MREVVIAGVGIHEFGRFPDKTYKDFGEVATLRALEDAGMSYKDIEVAFAGNVMAEMCAGQNVLQRIGLTGIPIINVETACASGGASLWLAYNLISTGVYDVALAAGFEKAPRGFIPGCGYDDWQMWSGLGINPLYFATNTHMHMNEYGTTEKQLALVAVKNHRNSVHNPYAMYRKEFTLEQVLSSQMVCEPLRLLMLCAPNEGGAAAVLCAKEVAHKYTNKPITIAGAALKTRDFDTMFLPAVSTRVDKKNKTLTESTVAEAYEMAGIGPEDLDLVELQDTSTGCEIIYSEELGLFPKGEGGPAVEAGLTEINGKIPINASGGLQSKGEPLGASSLAMVAELTMQLRGEAGLRQVEGAKVGLGHTEGAGGNCCVIILKK
jgi:acetyl-CoA acetyltransferase